MFGNRINTRETFRCPSICRYKLWFHRFTHDTNIYSDVLRWRRSTRTRRGCRPAITPWTCWPTTSRRTTTCTSSPSTGSSASSTSTPPTGTAATLGRDLYSYSFTSYLTVFVSVTFNWTWEELSSFVQLHISSRSLGREVLMDFF